MLPAQIVLANTLLGLIAGNSFGEAHYTGVTDTAGDAIVGTIRAGYGGRNVDDRSISCIAHKG